MSVILSFCVALFLSILVHILVWVSINSQFIAGVTEKKALYIAVAISIPLSLIAFFSSKASYEFFDNSAWGARFFGFSTSYLVFPIMTWILLSEPTFTTKNVVCFVLAILIVIAQIKL